MSDDDDLILYLLNSNDSCNIYFQAKIVLNSFENLGFQTNYRNPHKEMGGRGAVSLRKYNILVIINSYGSFTLYFTVYTMIAS